jgi:hypothetical protein
VIAPGDRVRYDGGGDYVRVGDEWWPGRIGYVMAVDGESAALVWEEGGTSTVPLSRLKQASPERFCQMCFRNVYLAHGAMTGTLMEWVPDREGEVTILNGRAVSIEFPEAERQRLRRRMMRADSEQARLIAHWRVCEASPKYLGVPSRGDDSRRTPARDRPA